MAESKVAIYGAIAANVAIAVTKFVVAGITGSSAMLSEGIHSAVDTFNGVLLAGVAVLLISQARGLLIGEGIRPETARAIRAIALAQPGVEDVGHVLSMYIGPDDVLVIVDVNFRDDMPTGDAGQAIAAIEKQVRARFPMIKRIFIEATEAPQADAAAAKDGSAL